MPTALFQPAHDYDTDGCYTPAIGLDSTVNGGLNPSGALNGQCRDSWDLDSTNGRRAFPSTRTPEGRRDGRTGARRGRLPKGGQGALGRPSGAVPPSASGHRNFTNPGVLPGLQRQCEHQATRRRP